jgi:hypothetical protein
MIGRPMYKSFSLECILSLLSLPTTHTISQFHWASVPSQRPQWYDSSNSTHWLLHERRWTGYFGCDLFSEEKLTRGQGSMPSQGGARPTIMWCYSPEMPRERSRMREGCVAWALSPRVWSHSPSSFSTSKYSTDGADMATSCSWQRCTRRQRKFRTMAIAVPVHENWVSRVPSKSNLDGPG